MVKSSHAGTPPGCHVLADIGGTNARFAWVLPGSAQLQCVERVVCADFAHFENALEAYLERLRAEDAPKPVSVCLAVAASVHEDLIRMTNSPWQFSRLALAAQLGVPVHVLNDFSAQAWCLPLLVPGSPPVLGADSVQWWQAGNSPAGVPCASTIVGPGTGFGAATMSARGDVLESEPGHVSFAPVTLHEVALLKQLWQRYPRVSVEHLLSGPGLANLYWANSRLQGGERELPAARIVEGALQGDGLCLQSVSDFTGILGSVCGDIALSMGSLGGMFLSGAMLEKMESVFNKALFMARFLDKGPFQDWCTQVPVAHLCLPHPGLTGCALYCRTHHDSPD